MIWFFAISTSHILFLNQFQITGSITYTWSCYLGEFHRVCFAGASRLLFHAPQFLILTKKGKAPSITEYTSLTTFHYRSHITPLLERGLGDRMCWFYDEKCHHFEDFEERKHFTGVVISSKGLECAEKCFFHSLCTIFLISRIFNKKI